MSTHESRADHLRGQQPPLTPHQPGGEQNELPRSQTLPESCTSPARASCCCLYLHGPLSRLSPPRLSLMLCSQLSPDQRAKDTKGWCRCLCIAFLKCRGQGTGAPLAQAQTCLSSRRGHTSFSRHRHTSCPRPDPPAASPEVSEHFFQSA